MKKSLLALIVASPFLTSCTDDNLEKCKTLSLDKNMQSIARSYCETAAQNGEAEGQFLFASFLLAENNEEQAVEWLNKSANQDNAQAMFKLGELYFSGGKKIEKNLDTARFYFEKSCEEGEIKGCERERFLKKKAQDDAQAKALALEKAKAATLAQEQAKLEVEAKAEEQKRLSEEARQKQAEADALKARTKNRKFYYGLAKYQEGNLWGHINQKGEIVIPLQWAYAADFYDGLAAVKTTEGKWGYIYLNGNYTITPRFTCVYRFTEGLAAVTTGGYGENCRGGKWGFIDKRGNWVVQPILDSIESVFRDGVAKVKYQGNELYIDKQGNIIEP